MEFPEESFCQSVELISGISTGQVTLLLTVIQIKTEG